MKPQVGRGDYSIVATNTAVETIHEVFEMYVIY